MHETGYLSSPNRIMPLSTSYQIIKYYSTPPISEYFLPNKSQEKNRWYDFHAVDGILVAFFAYAWMKLLAKNHYLYWSLFFGIPSVIAV